MNEQNGVMAEFVGGQTSGLFALGLYLGLSWMFVFIRVFAIPQYDDYKIEAQYHWRLCYTPLLLVADIGVKVTTTTVKEEQII